MREASLKSSVPLESSCGTVAMDREVRSQTETTQSFVKRLLELMGRTAQHIGSA